jgi:hypothetical protein
MVRRILHAIFKMSMNYFIFFAASLIATGLAWKRIFAQPYSWLARVAYLLMTLVPIVGPIFYLLIDPPESSPVAVKPEEFWHTTKGAGPPWPSFAPLMKSLSSMFRRRR